MDKNTLGYIRLAMLRNDKLANMYYYGFDKNRLEWFKNNHELENLEASMITSLGNMKPKSREALHDNVLKARESAEFEICRLNIEGEHSDNALTQLTNASKVKEATDYIELLLQIYFPTEFPNPFVNEVLACIERGSKSSHDMAEQATDETPAQVVMNIVNSAPNNDAITIKDDLVSSDYNSAPESSDPTSITEVNKQDFSCGELYSEGGIIGSYQPRIISLFEKYRELQSTDPSLNGMGTEEGNPLIDSGGEPTQN